LDHYKKAWKGSGKRFALAARCLARRYVQDPALHLKWWRRAVRVNVAHAPSQFALGVALLHQGIALEAVGCFAAAVHLIPDDAASWANLSAALQACEKIPQALVAAQHAVRHSNRDARMWDNLVQLAMEQGAVYDVARGCSVLVDQLGKLPLAALAWLVEWPGEWRNSTTTVQGLLDQAILAHSDQPRLYALRCHWAVRNKAWESAVQDAERHTRLLRRQLESDDSVWEELCRGLLVHADLILSHSVGDSRAFVMTMKSLLKTQEEKFGTNAWYAKVGEAVAKIEGK
jgi:tetratricopeptide (TPR) repeat protein